MNNKIMNNLYYFIKWKHHIDCAQILFKLTQRDTIVYKIFDENQ